MAKIMISNGLSVEYFDEYMHIQKKWRGLASVLFAVFAVIWMVGAYYLLILNGDEFLFLGDYIAVLLPTIYIVVLAGILYSVLGLWLNKTHIIVNRDEIIMKVRPIFWKSGLRIETTQINQIFVQKRDNNKQSYRGVLTYEVSLLMKVGKPKNLIDALDETTAKAIERRIEDYIGMKDKSTGMGL